MYLPTKTTPKGKLLLVTRDVDGGLGQHFVDLAEGMAARGWEVHCIRAERAEGHVTGHSARLDALPHVTVHTIPLARAIGPGDLRSYLEFRRIVERYGPFDIAHGHGAKGGVLVRLPCRGIGASVYTPHGFITVDPSISWHKKAIYGAIEGGLARFLTDAIVTVSTQEYQEALRLGAPSGACNMIPNGIARPTFLSRDRARIDIGLRPEHQVALFVGRFCHPKAPERFVSLVAALAPKCPDLRGVLIGGGELKLELVELAAALGVLDRILFFETAKASAYMQAADLLVVPSRYEGFPYAMLEALAAGLPIVTYDVGGALEVVKPGVNGFVIAQGNAGMLAIRTADILNRADLRAAMSTAAREMFRAFSLRSMVDRTFAVYSSEIWREIHRQDEAGASPSFCTQRSPVRAFTAAADQALACVPSARGSWAPGRGARHSPAPHCPNRRGARRLRPD